jgi:hypothetical protein
MDLVHLLLDCDTQCKTHHRRCHCETRTLVAPEMSLIEFLIRARSYLFQWPVASGQGLRRIFA